MPFAHRPRPDRRTRSISPARCSAPTAPSWSMPRATSRSSPMRCGRCSNMPRSCSSSCRADAVSYDDASNNRALISGKSALIWNPPSAWAVAKRDAPQVAADCWTFPSPAGPKGRVHAVSALLLGRLDRSPEQDRGEGADRIPDASASRSRSATTWWTATTCRPSTACSISTSGPRSSRRRARCSITRRASGTTRSRTSPPWPAPPEIAVQIYNRRTMPTMLRQAARQRQSIEQVIAWAKDELEGFTR